MTIFLPFKFETIFCVCKMFYATLPKIAYHKNSLDSLTTVFFYLSRKDGGKLAKLNLKQQKFADEYIISGNATESYKRVYSNVKEDSTASAGASRMLRNVKVKSYIEERLAELNSQKIADQEEILQYLTSVMRGEHREETLIGMGQGFQETTYMDVGAKDRIKAAELLGKRYSMWTDKQELTQRTIEITVGDWDEED